MTNLIRLSLLAALPICAASKFEVTPASFAPGKEYTITLADPGCSLSPKKPVFSNPLDKPLFGAHPSLKLQDGPASTDSCRFSFHLKVPESLKAQTIQLPLFRARKDEASELKPLELLDQVSFEIEGIVKGPIPPGVSEKGEVDIGYDVLPYRVTADNFGRRVAETYFAIQITVGNNSGYSLLLNSFFFRPKTLGNQPLAITPNTQYGAVRSTLEREQQVGRRAITVNIARGIIPMLSSAGALVDAGAAADFAAAAGMYGLAEKTFELVYPDKTVRQLIALDTRTFRDGMVLKNNDQKPILLFVHRELVMCAKKSNNCVASLTVSNSLTLSNRLPFATYFNPIDVKNLLGDLGLIGERIAFANRLVVTSIDETKVPVAPPATLFDVTGDLKIAQGSSGTIKASGLNLSSLAVSPPGGAKLAGITVEAAKLTTDGAAASISITVADDAEPKDYPIAVTAGGLTKAVLLTVASTKPTDLSVSPKSSTLANNAEAVITVTGKFLAGAKIEPMAEIEDVKFSAAPCDKTSCKITVKPALKFAATDSSKPLDLKLQIVKAGEKVPVDPVKLTVTK
jgi:hypothetical protein